MFDSGHVVGHEEHGSSLGPQVAHCAETLSLKSDVANGEHLVDEQDVRVEMRGDRKAQSHSHARRIAFDGRVDEPLDIRELDDLFQLAIDFAFPHPEDRAVEIHVLATAQLLVKTGANLEERANASHNLDRS